MEDIPDLPPSPLQYAIKLYSVQDVEYLSTAASSQTSGSTVFEDISDSNLERPPLPQHLSIHLYALPNLFLSESSENDGLHHLEDILEASPNPQQLSIGLYPLHMIDVPPERDPLPVSHRVDLFGITDDLPHLQPVPELTPFPPNHEISLFTKSDIEGRLSPTPLSFYVDPNDASDIEVMDSAVEIRTQDASHLIVGADTETQLPDPDPLTIRNPQADELELNYADAQRKLGSFSSVPYVGRVAEAVGLIIERCRNVEHYQKRVYAMASKCLEVVTILNSKISWLGSNELAENSNQLFVIFTNIQTFIQGWPRIKGAATLVGREEIRLALIECKDELELALDLVQIKIDEQRAQAYQWLARGEEGTQAGIKADRQVEIFRLPKLLDSEVECKLAEPIMVGRNADLWQGMWLRQEKVAIKVVRYASQSAHRKRLEREISTWINLKHKNILPFYGAFTKLPDEVHLVRPWQEEGNILEYTKLHPDVNQYSLMREAAEGLYYLHTNSVIHGNVRCVNILMDEDRAKLCDFGTTRLAEDLAPKEEILPPMPVRWLSPERIEGGSPSREADVYAFAMTILELVTGEHPYAEYEDTEVKDMVTVHKRPPRRPEAVESAEVLPDGLWNLMLECWQPGVAHHVLVDLASALFASSRRGE